MKKCFQKMWSPNLLVLLVCLLFIGCNSYSTVTDYDPVTEKKIKTTELSKESPLAKKAFSTGSAFTAVLVETSGSTTTGTPTPNVFIGGGCHAISSVPKDKDCPTFSCSWSSGIFNSLTNSSASSGSFSYVGVEQETGAETLKRVNGMITLKKSLSPKEAVETKDTPVSTNTSSETTK